MYTGRSACATHSQRGIRAAHEVNSRHNQTTLGGASLRFLQGCGFSDEPPGISESGPHESRVVRSVSVRAVTISSVASLF
jgi:hypothetical protein